jgi:GNAT superfamily N-acetyltransferase
MLVCDELTALGVTKELGGEGMLVFQPSTDESVTQSVKRRSLPAHPLAFGLRRNNSDLFSYIAEALRTFLQFESETISASYEALYWTLVKQIRECLAFDEALYLGGVRRLISEGLSDEFRETLLDQNARAYARRCLQLSRRSLAGAAQESDSWIRILRRTKERIQVVEASNRRTIKANLISAIKTVLGLDPVKTARSLSQEEFSRAIEKQASELRYILETDLDVDVPLANPAFRDAVNDSLERFVSRLQQLLEASAERANVTTVIPREEPTGEPYHSLRELYDSERRRAGGRPGQPAGVDQPVLIAFNLGEAVGFIATAVEAGVTEQCASLQITNFFVVEHMRGQGVSYRLIREVVDFAARVPVDGSRAVSSVWLDISGVPERVRQVFIRSGFSHGNGNKLVYQVDRLGT